MILDELIVKQLYTPRLNRKSNLELLRIVSMFLVVTIHYVYLRGPVTLVTLNQYPLSSIITLSLLSLSIVCTNCFILISGYFLIRWRLKSFCALMYQILFWTGFSILTAYYLNYIFLIDSPGINFAKEFMGNFTGRWFIGAYMALYILSPVLNAFIEKCTANELGKYILIFYLFSTLVGYIGVSDEFNEGMAFISLIGLYFIGAFLRKSECSWVKWRKSYDFAGYFIIAILLVIISIPRLLLGVNHIIFSYHNPLVIIESIFLFQFFRKWDIGSKPWINWIAEGAFAVYLFHINHYVLPWFIKSISYINTLFEYRTISCLIFIGVLLLSVVIIDKARVMSFQLLWNPKYRTKKVQESGA